MYQDEEDLNIDLLTDEPPTLTLFFQKFPPAGNFKDAVTTMTTEDIRSEVGSHSGTYYPPEALYNWLMSRGYNQETVDRSFVWLIGEPI